MKLEQKLLEIPRIDSIPNPQPAKAGGRLLPLTLLTLLLVGGAAFWLTRDGETREQWRHQAAEAIKNATDGTPLAELNDLLRGGSPLPPVGASSGASGYIVHGTVAAPIDATLPPQDAAAAGQQAQAVIPKVTADNIVRPDFIEDLAAWLVSQYKPGLPTGTLAVSAQSANQRYGEKMTGLSGDGQGGRAGILRYVFHPAMIQGMYALYVDSFLEAVQRESAAIALPPEQCRQLLLAVAGRSVLLAVALEGVASVPDLDEQIKKLEWISQNVVSVNSQMTQVVFDLDELRENRAAQSRIDELQACVTTLAARYRKELEDREAARRALVAAVRVAAVRKGGGQAFDEDFLLFLAHWVDRRLRTEPQALASVWSAAGVLRDLARRCAQIALQQDTADGALPAPVQIGGQGR
ncbi:hypothetical protein AGMMS49925_02400 [Deltaproteobacteria bacterium]|nr:hypothetical protein AGMMS49925_02400 [Deltaproteobacteria bacterium]